MYNKRLRINLGKKIQNTSWRLKTRPSRIFSLKSVLIFFQSIDKIIPIRLHQHEELLGADYFEHDIRHPGVGVSRAVSVLKHYHEDVEILEPKGQNEGKLILKIKISML